MTTLFPATVCSPCYQEECVAMPQTTAQLLTSQCNTPEHVKNAQFTGIKNTYAEANPQRPIRAPGSSKDAVIGSSSGTSKNKFPPRALILWR